jgi:amino acid adenylation domain-containing protein
VFQILFLWQNVTQEELHLPGLKTEPWELDKPTAGATFDLTFSVQETNAELQGYWEYNTNILDADIVEGLTGHFQTLLNAIVADAQQSICKYPLLTAAQKHQLLEEWNHTDTIFDNKLCVHQWFEAQVEQTPDAVAVVYEQQKLTYRELNQKANQLAHHLQSLGVKSEQLVGICVERSLEMVIGMLAILKAGGAYVPLDPTYPQERLTYMLEDAGVSVLLTQSKLTANFPGKGAKEVCFDRDWQLISNYSSDNPKTEVTPTNLAYVIYTSGSTGNPKGVAVPHQAIVRLVRETNYVQITPDDCIAQASNANFDAATFEIWGALLNGAKTVGITKEVMLSPEQLDQQLQKDKITILFITTALFNQLVSFRADIFQSVKTILFGGEAVNPSWVQAVLKNKPPARLLHVYGPTESTTFATWYLIEEVPEGATNIPIGRPLSNTTLYVLDSHLQPVPIGVPGELYIGGYGLARGYLNRPELTEQKFIPNPLSTIKSRLYKTGDLVRYLSDGSIEFLSRIDNQVKIRGFRIELGEIKAILEQHSSVKEAVAIAREDSDGNKQLVAYIVPQASQNELLAELRNFLQAQLPEYMIPSAFVLLDSFPLTVNEKIDTRSLPEPNYHRAICKTSENPQTEIEQKIAAVWQEILKLNSVGRDDNFFEVGGHSLLLIQVNQKLNAALNVELSMLEMFQYPTIRALGESLSKTKQESSPTTDNKGRRLERQNLLQQQRKARQQKR